MSSIADSEGKALSHEQDSLRPVFRQLHQITQPLSILQGVLELALVQARTSEDYKSVVVQALQQVERVTDDFDELRKQIELVGHAGQNQSGERRV